MRKSELIQLISRKVVMLSTAEISVIFDKFLDALSDTLIATGKVELRGFGSFCLRDYTVRQSVCTRAFLLKRSSYKRIYFRTGKKFFGSLQENTLEPGTCILSPCPDVKNQFSKS